MRQNTPFLPGLSRRLFGRQRRSQLDQLRAQSEPWRQSSLSRLCEIFGPWLPAAMLSPTVKRISRPRTCPLPLTFWAFLSQVLSPGSSCREIVRKVQAWSAPQDQTPDSGTGVSMPGTAAHQKAWPQPSTQKPGCGFPVVKLAACFCLASGALLQWVEGTLKEHDGRLLQKLLSAFKKGGVVLPTGGSVPLPAWPRCGRAVSMP